MSIPKEIIVIIFISGCLLITVNLKGNKEEFVDLDCSDFKTRSEAMEVFKQNKNDIHGLDRNGDLIPCNNLPN